MSEGRASDHIRALVCGYSSRDRAGKLLVMLQAFVDDSTSPLGGKRLFLAAYANTADNWAAFSDEWEAALLEAPRIDYAKMSEADSLQGQFRGWEPSARDAKILKLATIIRKFEPWSIHASVDTAECARIMGGTVPIGFARPYHLCFQMVVIHLAKFHLQKGFMTPVDFVFDEQGGIGEESALFYNWIKETQDPEVSALMGARPIFRDDKKMLPLQAADLLAWHVRRWREGVDAPGVRPAFNLLLADRQHIFLDMDSATLTQLAKGFRKIPGTKELTQASNWRTAKREVAKWLDAGHPPPDMPYWRMRLKYARRSMHRLYQRFRRAWRELTRPRRG